MIRVARHAKYGNPRLEDAFFPSLIGQQSTTSVHGTVRNVFTTSIHLSFLGFRTNAPRKRFFNQDVKNNQEKEVSILEPPISSFTIIEKIENDCPSRNKKIEREGNSNAKHRKR